MLYNYQKPHYEKIKYIIEKHNIAFDLSMMGTGKSIIAVNLIQELFSKTRVIIVSLPMIIKKTWSDIVSKYNIKAELITINKLRGENNHLLIKHPKYKKIPASYELSKNMKDFNGLIIIDELHMAKNTTLNALCVRELIKPEKNKKVLMMSGTLIDNLEQINHYMYMIGHNELTTDEFIKDFLHNYSSKMCREIQCNIEHLYIKTDNIANIYYELTCKYLNMGSYKIVIAVFYIELAKKINALFGGMSKLIIGETPSMKRNKYIDKFQENNLKLRIIVANANIISMGINLDDTHGCFPRICLLSPNYYAISTSQLYMRFSRANTKSMATIKFIYTNEDEYKMADSQLKKQEIIDII